MKKTVHKRSIQLNGRNCSISLEDEFWSEVLAIAAGRGVTIRALMTEIDSRKFVGQNLSSAVRVFVLQQYYAGERLTGSNNASNLEV